MTKKGKFSEQGKKILKRGKPENLEDFFQDDPEGSERSIQMIPINKIKPNPEQARKYFNDAALEDLSLSIKEKGILQPILVRKNDSNEIVLVAGERRLRASNSIGLEKIPGIFISGNPLEISLIENIQRENLSPLEEAEAYDLMINDYKYTQKELSKVIGKGRSTIAEILSLNKLPAEVKKSCRHADISKRTLIEIVKAGNDKKMVKLFNKVTSENLASDQVRKITRSTTVKRSSNQLIKTIKAASYELSNLQVKELNEKEYLKLMEELAKLKEILQNILS